MIIILTQSCVVRAKTLGSLGVRASNPVSSSEKTGATEDQGGTGTDPWQGAFRALFPSELLFFPEFRACRASMYADCPSTPLGKVVCEAGAQFAHNSAVKATSCIHS